MPLYELRRYEVKVGRMRDLVELFQKLGFPAMQRAGHDKHLVGFFIADTGNRNELVHLWKFSDDAERRSFWEGMYANTDFDVGFAEKARPLLNSQHVQLLHEAPWGPHP